MFARYGSTKAEKAIIAYPRNIRVPYHVAMTGRHISTNKQGRKALEEGHFVSKKDGVHRFLPRSRVIAPVSANRIKVKNPYIFVQGDTLQILSPRTELGVFNVGEAIITLNNKTIRYTPVGAANSVEAATMLANYFNSLTDLTEYLEFIPSADKLFLYSPAGQPSVTFTHSGSIGAGTATTAPENTPIGTVQAVDMETEELILGSNAVGILPVNSVIGVLQDEILGVFPHSVDYTPGGITGNTIGVIDEAKLYKFALPHWDNSITYECPRLHIREVWS